MKEYRIRSIIKTISWRFLATLITMSIIFIFTKRLALSLGVGLVEIVSKVIFYYLHERTWSKIAWGKPKHPLEDLNVKRELTPEDKKKIKDHLKSLGYM